MQPSFAHVAGQIRKATSRRELAKAAELIQHVGGCDEQNQLGKIYKKKAEEFKR